MKRLDQHPFLFFSHSAIEQTIRMIRCQDRKQQIKAIVNVLSFGLIAGLCLHLLSQLVSVAATIVAIGITGVMIYRKIQS